MKTLFLFLLLCLIGVAPTESAERAYSNDFLNLGGGARPTGLADAMVADTADGSAGLYNPAALQGIDSRLLLLSHSEVFGGLLKHDFGSFVMPYAGHVLNLWLIREAATGILDTRGFDTDSSGRPIWSSDKLGEVKNVNYALGFAYAGSALEHRLRYGATLKFIYRQLAELEGEGVGLDAGAQYLLGHGITAGAVLKNVTAQTRYYTDDWESAPTEAYLGISWKQAFEYIYGTLEITLQSQNVLDKAVNVDPGSRLVNLPVNLGIEYGYENRVFFRLGSSPTMLFTAGAGFRIKRLTTDIAYLRHPELQDSYRLSMGWDF